MLIDVVPEQLYALSKKLPKFPDGRIDYSDSDIAMVMTVFVRFQEKFLVLKRSNRVGSYPGKWNAVAGYLDELKPLKAKAFQELEEETGITKDIVHSIKVSAPYDFKDSKLNKRWMIYPILVELSEKPDIRLNWEHTEYRWVTKDALLRKDFDAVPNFEKSLKHALGGIQ